jgi:hypothetical protein
MNIDNKVSYCLIKGVGFTFKHAGNTIKLRGSIIGKDWVTVNGQKVLGKFLQASHLKD